MARGVQRSHASLNWCRGCCMPHPLLVLPLRLLQSWQSPQRLCHMLCASNSSDKNGATHHTTAYHTTQLCFLLSAHSLSLCVLLASMQSGVAAAAARAQRYTEHPLSGGQRRAGGSALIACGRRQPLAEYGRESATRKTTAHSYCRSVLCCAVLCCGPIGRSDCGCV
jgi:hypothetical protein